MELPHRPSIALENGYAHFMRLKSKILENVEEPGAQKPFLRRFFCKDKCEESEFSRGSSLKKTKIETLQLKAVRLSDDYDDDDDN